MAYFLTMSMSGVTVTVRDNIVMSLRIRTADGTEIMPGIGAMPRRLGPDPKVREQLESQRYHSHSHRLHTHPHLARITGSSLR